MRSTGCRTIYEQVQKISRVILNYVSPRSGTKTRGRSYQCDTKFSFEKYPADAVVLWSFMMSYSILVRKIDSFRRCAPEILACEIGSRGEAYKIVRELAASYGEFGLNAQTSVYWFRNTCGLHEIWPVASR